MKRISFWFAPGLLVAMLPSCWASQSEVSDMKDRLDKELTSARASVKQLESDLAATRTRLDNALKANAENGSDLSSSKQRIAQLTGRVEEANHAADEAKREVAQLRAEISKGSQSAAPSIPIPADKTAHFSAVDEAYRHHDFSTLRALGSDYVSRYPSDDKGDIVLFYMGDADLKDGRPTSALASFNKLLKSFPKSKTMPMTLFDMGEAYLALHNCPDAKLAFSSCVSHAGSDQVGKDAKDRIKKIDSKPAGLCQ